MSCISLTRLVNICILSSLPIVYLDFPVIFSCSSHHRQQHFCVPGPCQSGQMVEITDLRRKGIDRVHSVNKQTNKQTSRHNSFFFLIIHPKESLKSSCLTVLIFLRWKPVYRHEFWSPPRLAPETSPLPPLHFPGPSCAPRETCLFILPRTILSSETLNFH